MGLLQSVTREAPQLPSRVVLYAPEKAGKTSFGCHAPNPIFLMTSGETGLLSLIESGQVPPTAHFPEDFRDWPDLLNAVNALIREDHDYKTLVLDTGNGAEALCADYTCQRNFGGDWVDYDSYGRGMKVTIPAWTEFLGLLDTLRVQRKMAILFLHHARVKTFQNPAGKDWDQWKPEAIDKLWALTHKWADVIAFYGIKVNVNKDDKAYGTEQRFLRCGATAAIVAGNRYGMPDEITSAAGASNLWQAFAGALSKAKAKARERQAQAPTQDQPQQRPAANAPAPAPATSPVKQEPESQPAPEPEPEPEPGDAPPDHIEYGDPVGQAPAQDQPKQRPATQKISGERVQVILQQLHVLDMSWPQARGEFGKLIGLNMESQIRVGDLTPDQADNLEAVLKPRVEAKQKRARKPSPSVA